MLPLSLDVEDGHHGRLPACHELSRIQVLHYFERRQLHLRTSAVAHAAVFAVTGLVAALAASIDFGSGCPWLYWVTRFAFLKV